MFLRHGLIKFIGTIFIVTLLSFTNIKAVAQAGEPATTLEWYSDINEAKQDAISGGKYVMLYFSGTDWSKPCDALNKKILDTATFSEYAKGNLVPVKLDYPKMGKKKKKKGFNEGDLAKIYNPNGVFPLLVFLDGTDRMVGFTGFNDISPSAYVSMIENILN